MKHILALLCLIPSLLVAVGQAEAQGFLEYHWVPPTQYTDKTTLTTLTGYRIEYGTQANALTKSVAVPNPGLTTARIDSVPPGTYYGVVIALSSLGSESDPSQVVTKTITDATPPPPPPLVTAGPYSYEDTGTASAPKMAAIGLVIAGLPCGSTLRQVGAVKFCQITRAQTDLIGWPIDKTLAKGLWAKTQ